MDKDDVIKFIDGKVFYYSDYIIFLYKQLELKDNIIKEAREYIKEHSYDYREGGIARINGEELLEILEKENK